MRKYIHIEMDDVGNLYIFRDDKIWDDTEELITMEQLKDECNVGQMQQICDMGHKHNRQLRLEIKDLTNGK